MTDKCEPPPEWREREGLHLVQYDTGDCADVVDAWTWVPAGLIGQRSGAWTQSPGRENAEMIVPADVEDQWSVRRLRYLRPVPSADVLRQVEEVLSDLVDGIATGHIRYRHGPKLRSALAALAALRGTP